MPFEHDLLRRTVTLAAVLLYWGGVIVQGRRVRRHIGRAPNVMPRGRKETLLWLGWLSTVAGWIAFPFVAGDKVSPFLLGMPANLLHPLGLAVGLLLVAAGYAGTLWCYSAMGDSWRMGIDKSERPPLVRLGPYKFVRHPIYMFQFWMNCGFLVLLPTLLGSLTVLVQLLCVLVKAADEETFLRQAHGETYREYCKETGRLWPRLR